MIELFFIILAGLISSLFTEVFNLIKFFKKHRRHDDICRTYIDSEDIVYGIPSYDFFDHEQKAYSSSLINIKLNNEEPIIYDFLQSFEQNCLRIDKLKRIKECLLKFEIYDEDEIERVIREKIFSNLPQNNSVSYMVDTMFKSRKDQLGNPEASTLNLVLLLTDKHTIYLIDNLFNNFQSQYPEHMRINFKSKMIEESEVKGTNELLNFATSIFVCGFTFYRTGEKRTYICNSKNVFTYNLPLSDIKGTTKFTGDILKHLIRKGQRSLGNNINSINTKVTDIAVSYADGIKIICLSANEISHLEKLEPEYKKLTMKNDYIEFRTFVGDYKNDNNHEFALLYLWSLNRRIKNNNL